MLKIENITVRVQNGRAYLSADIICGERGTNLWFSLDASQSHYLCRDRCDAFVMVLLPMAMREGHDIVCEIPMSKRLHHHLEHYLIPILSGASDKYHPTSLRVPVTDKPVKNLGAVGAAFSGGVDSLYTIMTHGENSAYPITHLTSFNAGFFGNRKSYQIACEHAKAFGREQNLEMVFLDTNLAEALQERVLDLYGFRNLGCALVLQPLFSVYLLSSAIHASQFILTPHESSRFDLLTVYCVQTEALAVHLPGCETKRIDKLRQLAEWEPSHRWLHACSSTLVGQRNCGACKKCIRDQVALYFMDLLDVYADVYDVTEFRRHLAQRIGFILATDDGILHGDIRRLMEESKKPIPPAAYVFEKQFRLAMERMMQQ